ncbi:MAG TPA: response regulator transcription factor, partial [Roseovarius sp.]|nr:response regulator transcription factor [Roseovarius sp.]
MTTSPIRVVIVDDHPMVAEGIQSILESYEDVAVIATCSTGQEIIDRVEHLAPDVILLDLNMPGLGGLSTAELLLERRPGTRILILSMHDSPEYISSALSHGAAGYVLKDVPTDEIKRAIDAVMAGQRYLCTGAQGSLAPFEAPDREQLTNREQTILLQLAQGKSNREVAETLDISVRTVETHRKNIKR